LTNVENRIKNNYQREISDPPELSPQRSLQNLYAGGGIFLRLDRHQKFVVNVSPGVFSFELRWFWLIHLFVVFWSAATLILMHSFLLSAILMDGCRVLFVYIQHKRAFE
jgi:hypothetical protein